MKKFLVARMLSDGMVYNMIRANSIEEAIKIARKKSGEVRKVFEL